MCGITDFFGPPDSSGFSESVRIMADILVHRGLDDSGVWTDASAGISLAHRRLLILDLSAEGHQPMISTSGRYEIVFNGEIYNHLELRTQLDAIAWCGQSDRDLCIFRI
jgi:asparagine synthase (glutamine-hydrolysing)